MKKTTLFFILSLFLFSAMMVSCTTGTEQPESSSVGDLDVVVLEMVGLDSSQTFTMSDIEAMPRVEGWGGTKSSAGVITVPQKIVGVDLVALN